jgi:glycosyltransferase involved in cell wall biosynthesis
MSQAFLSSPRLVAEYGFSSKSAPESWATRVKTLPETKVVFLVNFVAPNLLEVFRELSHRFKSFTVVSSVPMEGNRQWKLEDDGLDVRIQRTWTITRTARHPSGYAEPNYIHIPLDSWSQLRRLKPDVVISLELGARTAFSAVYRLLNPSVTHVAAVLASERSEAGRGALRRFTRRVLLKRVDAATYNGPSCNRYLQSLGADKQKLAPWDYAADPRKAYRGTFEESNASGSQLRLLTVGQLTERKGVLQAASALNEYARAHRDERLTWTLVGDGPLRAELEQASQPENFTIHFAGHCDPEQIREHYRTHDAMLFPTLGDEWGLVVDESLASGLPVIGSCHSQAVETIIHDGDNGFRFDPEEQGSLSKSLERYRAIDSTSRLEMKIRARQTAQDRTPHRSASQMVDAVICAMKFRGQHPRVDEITREPSGENGLP